LDYKNKKYIREKLMNNFLAIKGSKETIDRLTDLVVKKGVQRFVIDVQSDFHNLADGYSLVKNERVREMGSLITFERVKETELQLQICIIGNSTAATIGVAVGIAGLFKDIRVEHKFFKKKTPYVGGYFIENRKLDGFFCWQTNSEICNAITQFIGNVVLDQTTPHKVSASFVKFLSREQRAGICHDYFEDNYSVDIGVGTNLYLRVSREERFGDNLKNKNEPLNDFVIGDIVWSPSEGSIVEGLLHEFIQECPTKFYQKTIFMEFSHFLYSQIKKSVTWNT
jgi:hypothetical protein